MNRTGITVASLLAALPGDQTVNLAALPDQRVPVAACPTLPGSPSSAAAATSRQDVFSADNDRRVFLEFPGEAAAWYTRHPHVPCRFSIAKDLWREYALCGNEFLPHPAWRVEGCHLASLSMTYGAFLLLPDLKPLTFVSNY